MPSVETEIKNRRRKGVGRRRGFHEINTSPAERDAKALEKMDILAAFLLDG